MAKLREVLMPDESDRVHQLKMKLLKAKTRKEIEYYYEQIMAILRKAETRYYAEQEVRQKNNSERSLDK